MLAMVIRVMIGCVSTNHKSDCEIWPNSFLAAPVSRGEKCLMRSFPPVSFLFLFSLLSLSLFSPSSLEFKKSGIWFDRIRIGEFGSISVEERIETFDT